MKGGYYHPEIFPRNILQPIDEHIAVVFGPLNIFQSPDGDKLIALASEELIPKCYNEEVFHFFAGFQEAFE